jgi:hypothetical protein
MSDEERLIYDINNKKNNYKISAVWKKCKIFTGQKQGNKLCKKSFGSKSKFAGLSKYGTKRQKCFPGFYVGECRTYLNDKDITYCAENNGKGSVCHPYLLRTDMHPVKKSLPYTPCDANDSYYDCSMKILCREFLRKNIDPLSNPKFKKWVKSKKKRMEFYHNFMKYNCQRSKYGNKVCKKFCSESWSKNCPDKINDYCAHSDKVFNSECKKFSNYKLKTIQEAKYKYCKEKNRFLKGDCFDESMRYDISDDVVNKYTKLWEKYCKKHPTSIKCSCFTAKNNLTKYNISPDCIPACKIYDESGAFQPLSVRHAKDRKCPNICAQIVKLSAKDYIIADNLNLVQNCKSGDGKNTNGSNREKKIKINGKYLNLNKGSGPIIKYINKIEPFPFKSYKNHTKLINNIDSIIKTNINNVSDEKLRVSLNNKYNKTIYKSMKKFLKNKHKSLKESDKIIKDMVNFNTSVDSLENGENFKILKILKGASITIITIVLLLLLILFIRKMLRKKKINKIENYLCIYS